ncbi:Hypothetical predicted protein [Mytilus galloprovincialis]|uniref:Farnesoic acid O-methyl transferase domain-containing protein n=1 Tax=Mytilus galloprovincialis TaxID=29158 RepID=A0A8B6BXV9_MYTGA|nr:Hypothetical predicted protein [Mytilus galloprovincialis]
MILSWIFVAILTSVGLGNLLDYIWFETKNSGSIDAYTPNVVDSYTSLSNYQIYPANNRFIKFHVKACENAFVLLSSDINLHSSNFYEICIDGHSKTQIYLRVRRKTSNVPKNHSFDKPGLLNCSEHRTFIVKWEESGRITLTAGTEVVMDWTDTTPIPIQGIGLMTGWGSDGMWIVEHSSLFTGYYCGVTGSFGDMTLFSTSHNISVIRCSSECALSEDCLGFNFQRKKKICQFVAGGQPVVKSVARGWKFYTKCLRENTMCLGCIV